MADAVGTDRKFQLLRFAASFIVCIGLVAFLDIRFTWLLDGLFGDEWMMLSIIPETLLPPGFWRVLIGYSAIEMLCAIPCVLFAATLALIPSLHRRLFLWSFIAAVPAWLLIRDFCTHIYVLPVHTVIAVIIPHLLVTGACIASFFISYKYVSQFNLRRKYATKPVIILVILFMVVISLVGWRSVYTHYNIWQENRGNFISDGKPTEAQGHLSCSEPPT